jgi:hypothetical protein
MGHVETCIVLTRCIQEADNSSLSSNSNSDEEDKADQDIVFQVTTKYVAVKVNYCDRMDRLRRSRILILSERLLFSQTVFLHVCAPNIFICSRDKIWGVHWRVQRGCIGGHTQKKEGTLEGAQKKEGALEGALEGTLEGCTMLVVGL